MALRGRSRAQIISAEASWIIWGGKMHSLGSWSPGATSWMQASADRIAWRPSRNVKRKGLAYMHVWWPDMDREIKKTVVNCHECQKHQASPPPALLQPWSWSKRPWSRIHMDYAGPKYTVQSHVLVIIDVHSKWIEAYPTTNGTASSTVEKLQALFTQFGLP